MLYSARCLLPSLALFKRLETPESAGMSPGMMRRDYGEPHPPFTLVLFRSKPQAR
jgi:hypothetical protein